MRIGVDDEAAMEGSGHVVGMPLECNRLGEHVRVQLEQMVRAYQARDDRRGAGAESAGQRYLRVDLEAEAICRVQALECAHAQVLAPGLHRDVRLDGELTGLFDLELQVQRDRRSHAIESGSEIGR